MEKLALGLRSAYGRQGWRGDILFPWDVVLLAICVEEDGCFFLGRRLLMRLGFVGVEEQRRCVLG